jgi:peptidoglycan/xylan/chitin deacetylase (PgdA/CDA1 family)
MPLSNRWYKPFKRFQNRLSPSAVILHYHRIADLPSDPYRMSVTPTHFAEQLEILKSHTQPISLQCLVEALRDRNLPKRAVAVTFDDGYADNLTHAKPLLERSGIPAKVFVTTGYLESEREFWWDELESLLLEPGKLPEELNLTANGNIFHAELGRSADLDEDSFQRNAAWNLNWQEDPSPRHALFRELYVLLHSLSGGERRKVLDDLLHWAGRQPGCRPSHQLLTRSELLTLAEDGLVEIGSHTESHPFLASLSRGDQQSEIQHSKTTLEKILDRPIVGFAYPHGSGTAETIEHLQKAGYSYACSSKREAVNQKPSLYELPRIGVKDWDGETFARWLEEW